MPTPFEITNLVASAARVHGLDEEDVATFEPMRAAVRRGDEPRKAPSTDELKARRQIQRNAFAQSPADLVYVVRPANGTYEMLSGPYDFNVSQDEVAEMVATTPGAEVQPMEYINGYDPTPIDNRTSVLRPQGA
jgi:hypothetical protein